jgi:hypothetical protein
MPILDFRLIALTASLSLCAAGAAAAQEPAPATVPAPPAAAQATAAPAPRRDRNRITAEEFAGRTESDALSFIRKERPQWLRARGQLSGMPDHQLWVYRYDAKIGGVETLRDVALSEVLEIHYLDMIAATTRFGRDHPMGAIVLITR